MPKIELLEELHSNTRRTRITYKARFGDQLIALKCYRKPLYGFVHWWRAHRRGRRIRDASERFPPVVFSGWVPEARCFGFGTEFLQGSESLREILRHDSNEVRRSSVLGLLGEVAADLHSSGVVQPDGNLTNFLLGGDGKVWVIDEDDIVVCRRRVSATVAMSNLANIASRLASTRLRDVLVQSYLSKVAPEISAKWRKARFWNQVDVVRRQTEMKWQKRNIPTDREFD